MTKGIKHGAKHKPKAHNRDESEEQTKKTSVKTILTAFEEIIVPLWSITKLRVDKETGERWMKLRKLWTDNIFFMHEVEERFNMHIVE